jgi:hypothetical protein
MWVMYNLQILDEGDTYLNGTHSVALEKLHNFYQLCINEEKQDKQVGEVVQVCDVA